jgi:hypothetical protein
VAPLQRAEEKTPAEADARHFAPEAGVGFAN